MEPEKFSTDFTLAMTLGSEVKKEPMTTEVYSDKTERINDYTRLSQSELLDYINNLEMMLLEEIGKGVKLRFEIEDISKRLARAEKDACFHKSLHEVYATVVDEGLIHTQSKHPHMKILKAQLR